MRCFGRSLIEIAEPIDGPWAERVRAVAREQGIVVAAGMFTPTDDGRVSNTLLITGPGVEARYDKIHLFDAFGFAESRTVAPGAEPVLIKIDETPVGAAICYDVRFPDLFTRLADAWARLITGPGAEPRYDKLHLFDAFGFAESRTVAPGAEPVLIKIDETPVGAAICYDVRFPDLFTRLADDGAPLIILPASWGAGPGKSD